MDINEFLQKGWQDHPDHSEQVFQRLPEGLALVHTPAEAEGLARLAQHVAGEHLGRWDDGIAFLKRCLMVPGVQGDPSARQISLWIAVLNHCAGKKDEAATWEGAEQVRFLCGVASALAGRGRVDEAAVALKEAVDLGACARTLAVSGHNIALGLEMQPSRTDAEKALMIFAATTARRFWEVAGTWLEVERADYRLAMTMIAAGDPKKALQHALDCVDSCEDNAAVPYEKFYSREALSRAHFANGDRIQARLERDKAQAFIPFMKEEFQPGCTAALGRLDRLLGLA